MKQSSKLHENVMVYKAFEEGWVPEAVYLACVTEEHPLEMLKNFLAQSDIDNLREEYMAAIA
jgi:hypothetical protein